ncbi:MATE family efflux transporter [Aminobacter aminovorans]|uniref:Multidrug export protein MepA n=1 Tax=Aminobacter aminovorans TaxID=83263 RepID=A0AAC8YRZ8_AMIAI|nr:MATE family efflux transporter [Aminobacter aminovorans]AMS43134.1 Multi antimicrobial extrusion protein MatE [Aminobacter aminovorans]MBB3708569.1 putative MATE family efflux protein [Aminobacter aminovorans]
MTSLDPEGGNAFLHAPLPGLFLRTAAPIILIMATNGLLAIVDAYFLGEYVGPDALAAVTLMFPAFMLLVALSTLVASGMASQLARLLGAGERDTARATFLDAHALAFLVCVLAITAFLLGGKALALRLANGSQPLAEMGYDYIAILIWGAPLTFALSLNGDGLRCEGRLGLVAAASLLTSVANAALNYVLIVGFDLGVSGSALGTVLAQAFALGFIVVYRRRAGTVLQYAAVPSMRWTGAWRQLLSLGAPQSLSYIGISLLATSVITATQLWEGETYAATVAAYGIITRIMTFAFLPMLGLNMAMQTIVGNNFGAGLWQRSDAGLKLGLGLALAYCGLFEAAMLLSHGSLGAIFVDDAATQSEVARILPMTVSLYILAGPVMMLSGYFQAIGDARRALLLSVVRTYLLAIPLTIGLPHLLGERGIWLASPMAELLMVLVVSMLLLHARASTGFAWGLFRARVAAA